MVSRTKALVLKSAPMHRHKTNVTNINWLINQATYAPTVIRSF
jgi:hypothetical protein